MLADNPGIVPRPVLGPVLNNIDAARPFINSIARKPLPAGTFDRPTITQHVAVDKQTAEKTLTACAEAGYREDSGTADTFAGHLNISRQDIKWTSPGILQIVFEDFAAVYANATDNEACEDFAASVTTTRPRLPRGTRPVFSGLSTAGPENTLANSNALPDTLWVRPDVWGRLGSLQVPMGGPLFPGISPRATSGGSPGGLHLGGGSQLPQRHHDPGAVAVCRNGTRTWTDSCRWGSRTCLGSWSDMPVTAHSLTCCPAAYTKFTVPAPVA